MSNLLGFTSPRDLFGALKEAANGWMDDHATRLAAALAYYRMLSLAPMLVITIKIIGVWFQNAADAQSKVIAYHHCRTSSVRKVPRR